MSKFPLLSIKQLQRIFQQFETALNGNAMEYAQGTMKLNLPVIDRQNVIALCYTVEQIFANEPILHEIDHPVYVVGDIHGHILDLIRIFKELGLPKEKKFLFLGDLVDRGEFSVETIILLFVLKALFPLNVLIIRGNHEFEYMASQFGFGQQLHDLYGNDALQDNFYSAFTQMPLAARIFKTHLAVHGGIGPSLFGLNQILSVKRPMSEFGDDNTTSLLWSDPSDNVCYFAPSSRGTGYFFGPNALNEFLNENKISILIRGHECVPTGIDYKFNHQIVTVFSASNYCGIASNNCGVLQILGPMERKEYYFPPLPYLLRRSVFVVKQHLNHRLEAYESVKRLPRIDPYPDLSPHSLSKQNITRPHEETSHSVRRDQTSPLIIPQVKYSIHTPEDIQMMTKARPREKLKLPVLSSSFKARRRSLI